MKPAIHLWDATVITVPGAVVAEDSRPDLRFPGTIVRNADAIDHSTRTLNVEMNADNVKDLLRPGAYVFVHFHLPPIDNTVTIPSNTLLFRTESLRVCAVHGVQRVPVHKSLHYDRSDQGEETE
jgi:multidrug efflux pump subunit AcrA (membrane-fusion protein)